MLTPSELITFSITNSKTLEPRGKPKATMHLLSLRYLYDDDVPENVEKVAASFGKKTLAHISSFVSRELRNSVLIEC